MASGAEICSHSSIHSAEGDGGGKKDGIEEVVDLRTYHRLQAKRTIFGLDAVHLAQWWYIAQRQPHHELPKVDGKHKLTQVSKVLQQTQTTLGASSTWVQWKVGHAQWGMVQIHWSKMSSAENLHRIPHPLKEGMEALDRYYMSLLTVPYIVSISNFHIEAERLPTQARPCSSVTVITGTSCPMR